MTFCRKISVVGAVTYDVVPSESEEKRIVPASKTERTNTTSQLQYNPSPKNNRIYYFNVFHYIDEYFIELFGQTSL